MASGLQAELSKKTFLFGLKVWVLVGIFVGVFIVIILLLMSLCLTSRKKSRRANNKIPLSQIPAISKEIKEVRVDQVSADNCGPHDGVFLALKDKFSDKESEKVLIPTKNGDNSSQSGSFNHVEKDGVGSQSGEEVGSGTINVYRPSSHPITAPSPLNWFARVFSPWLGPLVYIKGPGACNKPVFEGKSEKEFRVEVEAIGHVRHKNLVRLLGYCIEGTHRLLVYEYVNNGNLEQWLHGAMRQHGYLTWEARMKILLGTAKALAYLHEAIEPKVVHRDIKSSNILIDDEFNAKISDFGLAKLLGAGRSHITTRVMGTFGYVAPEYANSGLLNEKSDVYSFGVVLLEAITGRDPVDYGRPAHEVNLVDWLKMMVGSRRSEEVVDPNIETRPSTSALKRGLLTALRCVDPDADKRPKMSQVVRMLESEEYPIPREDRRRRRSHAGNNEAESQRENSDTDRSEIPDSRAENRRKHRTSAKGANHL
uniref:non-specific serine/threonine protein kinase n=1 Tax=Vitis vinifera TaxID=29760 RepID=A5CBM3_VITVI|nr:hypothetical protein VITISV_001481 [Vitis vinifera]